MTKPPAPGVREPAALGGAVLGVLDHSPESNIACEDIFEYITKKQPRTILALLEEFHRRTPRYFSHYVLLPNSLSLHGSTYAHPRAVVTGADAQTIISYNGDPTQEGYERLEMMCFKRATSRFDFYEVTFPGEARVELADLTPRERQQASVISPVNGGPQRSCVACHQSPARPNWDTYNLWPSAYGAVHDDLFRPHGPVIPVPSVIAYDAAEKVAFQAYERRGRYGVLRDIPEGQANEDLGTKLTTLNGERIVAELQRLGPRFEKMKSGFARALWCPVPGMKADQLTKVPSASAGRMIHESAEYRREKFDRLKQNFGVTIPPDFPLIAR